MFVAAFHSSLLPRPALVVHILQSHSIHAQRSLTSLSRHYLTATIRVPAHLAESRTSRCTPCISACHIPNPHTRSPTLRIIMPFRDQAKRFFHRAKDRTNPSSRERTPDPPSTPPTKASTSASHNPLPSTAPCALPSQSAPVLSPDLSLGSTSHTSALAAHTDNPDTMPVQSLPPSGDPNIKHTKWTGLEAFDRVVKGSTKAFGPLVPMIDGVSECFEWFVVRFSVAVALHDLQLILSNWRFWVLRWRLRLATTTNHLETN